MLSLFIFRTTDGRPYEVCGAEIRTTFSGGHGDPPLHDCATGERFLASFRMTVFGRAQRPSPTWIVRVLQITRYK